ncbi:MAG TPA: LacI family DNA-binding transcriptional regulator [Lichenihabitans sp.]|jgi:LacI family transcriptional regulator|nr:LacI family DNA-binding transcriptional regulator [Lichenihabitans sp.]
MTTMKDVARVARVSIATVSSALSGASYVSPDLKDRVEAAVRELGYAPNSIASGLKRGTTRVIGLIVPDITNPFFTELIQSVQRGARLAGYSVLLCDSEWDIERELSLIRMMRAHLAAGTILCPTGADACYGTILDAIGPMALVTVDSGLPTGGFDAVQLDNGLAARLATGHIIAAGHRRIGMMGGPSHLLTARGRLDGFLAAMRDAAVGVDPQMIRDGGFREDGAFRACQDLLALASRPTAIFVANNQMLIGVMRAIAAAGLSCPRDISVAAIDDFPWAVAFTPSLTTVRQPVGSMAAAALDMLLARLSGRAAEPRRIVVDPELVVRNSCAPPPAEYLRAFRSGPPASHMS